MEFKFPEEEELTIFLKDILEENVDEKYYLSDEQTKKLLYEDVSSFRSRNLIKGNVCQTLQAAMSHGNTIPLIIQVGMVKQKCKKRSFETPKEINIYLKDNKKEFSIKTISDSLNLPKTQVEHYFRTDKSRAIPSPEIWRNLKRLLIFNDTWDKEVTDIYEKEITFESSRRVYSENGISPCLSATHADKFILVKNATKKGYLEGYPGDGVNLEHPDSKTRRGRIQKDVIGCLQTNDQRGVITEDLRIRKLTPKECFRLMGFLNDEINLDGLSNTQRYKLAGNGWDINLVSKILKAMNLPDDIETFEMFAGYGGGSFALEKIKKPFTCVGYSEIDKFACQCYEQNHKGKAVGNCKEINPWSLDYFYLLMAGFPCQSFSVAGKGLGELDTRGTLFWDIIRVAEVKKPKYMLLENVKGLTNKKHKHTFDKILSELNRIGYDVLWKVCNTKLHGIPQNRDRIFFVCFRKDLNYSPSVQEASSK